MTYFPSLFSSPAYINLPQQAAGWIGFILMLALLVRGLSKNWDVPLELFSLKGALLAILTLSIPLTALNFGIQPDLLITNGAYDDYSTVIMGLSALPWILAADLLGVLPSVMLAIISGTFFAFWGTHSLFTPVEMGLAALLYNFVLRQKNAPDFESLTRHPIVAGMTAGAVMLFVTMAANFFAVNGGLAPRLDGALVAVWQIWLARLAALLIAAAFGEILYLVLKKDEPAGEPVHRRQPRPVAQAAVHPGAQTARKFTGATTIIALLLFVFLILNWLTAATTTRSLLRESWQPQAQSAAKLISSAYLTGQGVTAELGKTNLFAASSKELSEMFKAAIKKQPLFQQFYLIDTKSQIFFAYPDLSETDPGITPDEWDWLNAHSSAVQSAVTLTQARVGGPSAIMAFTMPVLGEDGSLAGLLVGHSAFDLASLAQTPKAASASDPDQIERWSWQVRSESEGLLAGYNPDWNGSSAADFEKQSPGAFTYTIDGTPWDLSFDPPESLLQSMTFQIAGPQMGLMLFLGLTAIGIVQTNSRRVAKMVRSLSAEASKSAPRSREKIAQMDQHDEVERLRGAFEEMNASLNDRLGELNRLLSVSQKIATSLHIEDNMRAILDAALVSRVASARILLDDVTTTEVEEHSQLQLGSGELTAEFAYLDDQIYELMRYQDALVVRNTLRIRRIEMPDGERRPGALVAFAINHDGHYHGAFWVAYDQPFEIPEEEIRYLNMLAGDASIAAANFHLFSSAEVGRQRLEAVLAATPEPVLVMDAADRLLLLNPAAIVLPGLVNDSNPGQKIEDILLSPDLISILQGHKGDQVTTSEIKLQNGRVYHVSVSSIIAEGVVAGKVCNLRDITHYKETDTLKSDFVATVSHDLRSPLTLMRGYTTMMQMVGELNEQQVSYTEKILTGIGSMERLVNNVLDLEKIESNRGLKREKVVAVELINHIVETLLPQAIQKKIELTFEQEINPALTFSGDRDLLRMALINLTDNAIKFTAVGGKVKLGARLDGGSLIFSVEDDGIGIAPLDQPKLFDRYFRSSRSEATQQRGSGLGLTIVKSIADLHKGRVWVDSQLGKGSRFFLEIPV